MERTLPYSIAIVAQGDIIKRGRMTKIEGCLSVPEARVLIGEFGSARVTRKVIGNLVRERKIKWLEKTFVRAGTIAVPMNLQEEMGDLRSERLVRGEVAEILLKIGLN